MVIMRKLTIQTFIYYLIYSGAREGFCKIMQCKETDFSRSIEMYHFGELSNVQDKIFK